MAYLVDVLIFKNVIGMDRLFTYKGTGNEEVGSYVIVDFNNRLEIGLVLNVKNGEVTSRTKTILKQIYELPKLNDLSIKLALWMKRFYVLTYAKAFSPLIETGKITNMKYEYHNISGNNNLLEYLKNKNVNAGRTRKPSDTLDKMIKDMYVRESASYQILEANKDEYFIFNLTEEEALDKIRPNANRQIQLTKDLYDSFFHLGIFSSKDVLEIKSYEKAVLDDLVKKDILNISDNAPSIKGVNNVKLTPTQSHISNTIDSSKDKLFLIHGVTGSGKTEVYFDLIEKSIAKGYSVKFLVPEIGLTPQMEQRTIKRFGDNVSIIHSKLSKRDRIREIEKLETGKSKILLGTRSSIFLQMDNLGLVIIDEEHDDSYKLNDFNKYDTREVARFLVENTEKAKLILGSATPSIESYYKAKHQVYNLFELVERPQDIELPEVHISDMRQELKMGNNTAFSSQLLADMKSTLINGKQILLFLNRRGYSPFVSCRECGYTIKCDNCDISMVYHKNLNYLTCHYCGSSKIYPKACPSCGSNNIKQFGMGTEQLEEMTRELFPDFKVLRIDSDTTNKRSDYEENFRKILNNEVDIIIGTQMTSKGFDFPDLQLVGVIAADLSLMMPEYDSAEKTFQLLTQVAGRSGRKNERGKVVFQTYNPEHYSIKTAMNHDYGSFYDKEIQLRKEFLYPPFTRQYILTIMHRDENESLIRSKEIYKSLIKIIEENGLINYVKFVSNINNLTSFKVRNRHHVEIVLASTVKHEQEIKNIIHDVLINNICKLDLRGFHMDLLLR